jgi:chromosome segregation ATPase
MMKFFKDLFSSRVQYDERIHELEQQREELEAQLAEFQRQFAVGIEKDALGIAPFTDELKIEKGIEKIRAEIAKVDQKIDIVRKGKRQALAAQIPALRQGLEEKRKEVDAEWEDALNEVQRAKAELVLALSALGDVGRKGQSLLAEYTALMGEADPESREAKQGMNYTSYRSRERLRFDFGPYTTDFKDVLTVPEETARNAYDGNIPGWVRHYMATGEIDFSKK